MPSKIIPICLTLAGLLVLGACSNSERAVDPIAASPTTTTPIPAPTTHGKSHPGGTTIETNGIHLELVPEKSPDKTHLDLYVQKGDSHEPISTAKVVAQIQAPDGKQQSLNLKYDAAGKHYFAEVPGKIAGQYQVKITADISGKKIAGRFNFDR
jgi:hypothetical protein